MVGLAARMGEELPAGDDGEGQTTEDLGDLDAEPAGIFTEAAPLLGAGAEVMVTVDEVVGSLHQSGADTAMAAAS